MLRVKTYLDRSEIHGIGLFAAEDISKGTIIWILDNGLDTIFSKKDLSLLYKDNISIKDFLETYCYEDISYRNGPYYILCNDDARFMNHSLIPNTSNSEKITTATIANRDIKKGEEITCNYLEIDDKFDGKF